MVRYFLFFSILILTGCSNKSSNTNGQRSSNSPHVQIRKLPYEIDKKVETLNTSASYYIVSKGDLKGVLKKYGDYEEIVVPIKYCMIDYNCDNDAVCYFRAIFPNCEDDEVYSIDGNNFFQGCSKIYLKKWNTYSNYYDNKEDWCFIWMVSRGKYKAVMDLNGNYIIPFERNYTRITPEVKRYGNNKILRYFVVKNGKCEGICDQNGKELLSPDNLATARVFCNDETGNISMYLTFEDGEDFYNYPKESQGKLEYDCYGTCESPFTFSTKHSNCEESTVSIMPDNGTNYNNSYNNNYNNSYEIEQREPRKDPCQACHNTGTCHPCNGTGKRLSEMSIVSENPVYRDCGNCGGTGTCSACGGDGWLNEGVDF